MTLLAGIVPRPSVRHAQDKLALLHQVHTSYGTCGGPARPANQRRDLPDAEGQTVVPIEQPSRTRGEMSRECATHMGHRLGNRRRVARSRRKRANERSFNSAAHAPGCLGLQPRPALLKSPGLPKVMEATMKFEVHRYERDRDSLVVTECRA